ncbi:hypothetical protein DFH06DRAFT_1141322 [Mycena polygramma]|nr:hypothetical protein DFH06DRAFT_1141322 [Mycena polygramma]
MATRAQLHRTMATRTQSHRRKNYIYLCGNYHPRVDPRVDPEVDPKVYPEVYPEVYRRVPPEKPRKGQTNMYMHYAPNGGTKEFIHVPVDSRAVETTVVYTLSSGCQSPNGARAEDGEAPRRAEANILAVADAARAGEVEPAPPALEDAEVQQPFCNVKSSIATTPDAITPQPNNNPPTARAFGVLPLAAAHAVGVARLQPDPPREFGVRDEQRAPEQYIHLPDVCVEVDVASPFALVRVYGLDGDKAENLGGVVRQTSRFQASLSEVGGVAYGAAVGCTPMVRKAAKTGRGAKSRAGAAVFEEGGGNFQEGLGWRVTPKRCRERGWGDSTAVKTDDLVRFPQMRRGDTCPPIPPRIWGLRGEARHGGAGAPAPRSPVKPESASTTSASASITDSTATDAGATTPAIVHSSIATVNVARRHRPSQPALCARSRGRRTNDAPVHATDEDEGHITADGEEDTGESQIDEDSDVDAVGETDDEADKENSTADAHVGGEDIEMTGPSQSREQSDDANDASVVAVAPLQPRLTLRQADGENYTAEAHAVGDGNIEMYNADQSDYEMESEDGNDAAPGRTQARRPAESGAAGRGNRSISSTFTGRKLLGTHQKLDMDAIHRGRESSKAGIKIKSTGYGDGQNAPRFDEKKKRPWLVDRDANRARMSTLVIEALARRLRGGVMECYSLTMRTVRAAVNESPKITVEDEKGRDTEPWRASTLKSQQPRSHRVSAVAQGRAEPRRTHTPSVSRTLQLPENSCQNTAERSCRHRAARGASE